jgi:hypothetical protein
MSNPDPTTVCYWYFGACPVCLGNDGYLNIGRSHYFTCNKHRACWKAGINLFPTWEDEDPEVWARNAKTLSMFEEVKPKYPVVPACGFSELVKPAAWPAEFKDDGVRGLKSH